MTTGSTPNKLYETAHGLPPHAEEPIPGPLSPVNICFQAADEAGCGGYRCILPTGQLRKLGANVKWTRRMNQGDYQKYDILVFQRPMEPNLARELKEVSRLGKLVLVEVDDNLHEVPVTSPVYEHYKPSKLHGFTDCLKAADGLIVSTPEIAKAYYKYNKNIAIAPNSIDFDLGYRDWSGEKGKIEKSNDEVILFNRSGITHQADFMVMKNLLHRTFEKYSNVKFALYSAKDMFNWMIGALELHKYQDRLIFVDPRKFVDFPTGMGGDIGLIPLVNSQFNDCKSELALCEFGALSIPVVCSDSAAYKRFAGANNDYAIAGGISSNKIPLDITTPLDRLIENKEERLALGQRAFLRTSTNYNLETNINYWLSGFSAILKQKQEGFLGPGIVVSKTGKEDPCPKCLMSGIKNPKKFKKCEKHWGKVKV